MTGLRTLLAGTALALLGAAQAPGAIAASPAMVVQSDIVRGVIQGMAAPGCVLNNQFKHKELVVFRVRVIDTKTGKQLDNTQLKSISVELPDGQKFPAHWGKHPPQDPVDFFWTYGWLIPADYPTGSFAYKITATDKKGHTASWEPFKSKPSQLTVLADNG